MPPKGHVGKQHCLLISKEPIPPIVQAESEQIIGYRVFLLNVDGKEGVAPTFSAPLPVLPYKAQT
jgi:hypothetical protein